MCPAMISNRFQHDLEAHGMSHPFIDRCLTSDQRIKTSGKLPMSRGHGKYQPSQDHIVEVEMTGRWQRRRQPRTPSRPESTRVDQSRPESTRVESHDQEFSGSGLAEKYQTTIKNTCLMDVL